MRAFNRDYYTPAVVKDSKKCKEIEQKLETLSEALITDPSLWAEVIKLGLGRMFESSEFPVLPDLVLKAGFSPLDWFLVIKKSANPLSTSVSEYYYGSDKKIENKIDKLLGTKIEQTKVTLNQSTIDRIKDVLIWDEVLPRLTLIGMQSLAFLWIVDLLISLESIQLPESEVEVKERGWDLLEKIVSTNQEEITKNIEGIINSLLEIRNRKSADRIEIANWSDIIDFPW